MQLGGTVGDIESAPFIEAMRQFQFRVGHENFALIHVSLVPDMHGEQKTKPTQATVRDLRGLGFIFPIIEILEISSHEDENDGMSNFVELATGAWGEAIQSLLFRQLRVLSLRIIVLDKTRLYIWEIIGRKLRSQCRGRNIELAFEVHVEEKA